MKSFYLLLLALTVSIPAYCQDEEKTDRSSEGLRNIVSLDILSPGISYEAKVSQWNTIVIGAHALTNATLTVSSYGTELNYLLVPAIDFEYRHYYNLEKRNTRNKKTWFNSANYYGAVTGVQMNPIAGDEWAYDYEPGFYIGPMWGIQRNGQLTFNLNLGIGYFSGYRALDFLGNIRVGVNLSKKTE